MISNGVHMGLRLLGMTTMLAGLSLLAGACGNDDGQGGGTAGSPSGGASSLAGNGNSAGSVSSSGSSGAGTSGANHGGNGGSSGGSAGSAPEAGSMSGGSAGAAGGGSGAHCTPGTVLHWPDEVYSMFGGPLTTCMGYEGSADGVPHSADMLVTDIALKEPLTAGAKYAFSTLVSAAPADGSITAEFWGTDSECGKGAEKLYSGPMLKGILCAQLDAKSTHQHLLMVWRGPGSVGAKDVAICPGGSCK